MYSIFYTMEVLHLPLARITTFLRACGHELCTVCEAVCAVLVVCYVNTLHVCWYYGESH